MHRGKYIRRNTLVKMNSMYICRYKCINSFPVRFNIDGMVHFQFNCTHIRSTMSSLRENSDNYCCEQLSAQTLVLQVETDSLSPSLNSVCNMQPARHRIVNVVIKKVYPVHSSSLEKLLSELGD